MRGIYTAAYLSLLAANFAHKKSSKGLDIGGAFGLIVGTSTGAIVACALAAGVSLSEVVELYREHGSRIFEKPLRNGGGWRKLRLIRSLIGRRHALERGTEVLRDALADCFGSTTLAELYSRRRIALCVTAVDMNQHRSWVFKTPHQANTNHRDDGYTLVDVCLASSAAPIYRSLASIDHHDSKGHKVFADGGLWANNPVLVGLTEALDLTLPGDRIEIFCLGTCPRPAGQIIAKDEVHRTLTQWKFGGDAAALAVDAQEFAFDNMARMIANHVDRDCAIVRFPHDQVPASVMEFLDLDETRDQGLDALISQARTDADMTNSRCGRAADPEGQLIHDLFMDVPVLDAPAATDATTTAV